MKLTFLGAGARTPLVIRSILDYQERLPISHICMMDVDEERLALMRLACQPWLSGSQTIAFEWTADPHRAIRDAAFIVTTFRVGLMASRLIDEQVPLRHGVVGQETTGPGGFAMALRTIPILLGYMRLIEKLAPAAWVLNFSNPAGLLTEAITRQTGYERVVGICDTPSAMVRSTAVFLGVQPGRLLPDYVGLNHLGWLRRLYLDGVDQVPGIIQALVAQGRQLADVPFAPSLLASLGAIPNEYNYFYYYPEAAVANIKKAGQSRAQQLAPLNDALYADLRRLVAETADPAAIAALYARYLAQRQQSYMAAETGIAAPAGDQERETASGPQVAIAQAAEGYTGVTLDLLAALVEGKGAATILNVPNRGAVPGLADEDVVEVTCFAGHGVIRPLAAGPVPDHALALMQRVKAYERMTIQAAVSASYTKAVEALALHPLVPSPDVARAIVDDYIDQHGDYFPRLN